MLTAVHSIMNGYILYFNGTVHYEGRASSTLGPGKFILIKKNDNSISIHGSTLVTARNYLGCNSIESKIDNKLIFKKNNETITIDIKDALLYEELNEWSDLPVTITKTERELVNKLVTNWPNYIAGEFRSIKTEYQTPLGNIDALGIDSNGVYHIIEVKRHKCQISAISQLKRYVDELSKNNIVKGYIASPSIGKNAERYLTELGFIWIMIDFS